MADLRGAYDGVVATDFDRLRGRILTAKVRLYPDTALYYLAARDGLLAVDDGASGQPERFGYFPDRAWRFRDPTVARFATLAAAASDATHGRDERRVFRALLDAFGDGDGAAVTLADVLARLAAPPAPPAVTSPRPRSQRTIELELGRGCGARCAICPPVGRPPDLTRALRGGAARVVVRGGGGALAALAPIVAQVRAAGASEVIVAGHVDAIVDGDAARAWAAAGVDAALVPVVSQVPAVHDRAVGRDGALVATLVAVRALAAVGVAIELEVPIVAARLQDLAAVVELFARAVPELRAVRLRLPRHAMPRALAPPPLAELGPRLEAALAAAARLGVRAPIDVTAALPLCALVSSPRARAAVRFDPRRATAVSGCTQPAACAGCAVAAQCPGVPTSYLAAHGDRDLRPLTERPADLYAQRTTPLRVWDDRARAAARQAGLLVLRPTVHCNQDCGFCSANESTPNVWADPARMVREIARAARRGVERVSFSGGEPTLARELPTYVAVARRAGVKKIELVTNGVLLDRRARVDALIAAGLTHAFVSLHGHDEASASAATRKVGDFARTIAAIGHLVAGGVITVVNHVIHAGNAALLTRFVEEIHARFAGRVMISFAFVTPQYKALEHLALVPRLTDVAPQLQAACWRALALGQPFVIGSRQGVPPCFLGPFVAWSDLMQLAHEAQAEDAPQKQQGPGCGACRFARYCTGLWKPYAAREGFGELSAVAGTPLGPDERAALLAHARRPPWGQPMAFDDVHPLLRDAAAEAAGPPTIVRAPPPPPVVRAGARPLRLLMVGCGARARALARAAHATGAWAVTGVCSPHADVADRADFAGAPAFTELAAALDATRPDAVVIASSTTSHVAAVERALAARLPILLEKPLAGTVAETEGLVARAAAAGVALMPAHNDRFAPGLDDALAAARGRALTIVRLTDRRTPAALHAWHRAPVFEGLYHLAVIAHAHGGAATG
ncbi:MAG: radical SAM protein [Myxococcales bacterium]|nr:radical SAM protein [Myxococcales bacterium]